MEDRGGYVTTIRFSLSARVDKNVVNCACALKNNSVLGKGRGKLLRLVGVLRTESSLKEDSLAVTIISTKKRNKERHDLDESINGDALF